MCGICGFVNNSKTSDTEVINEMTKTLHYRGPDDSGNKVYNFDDKTVAFGQTRLSIIDLSSGGHQPMEYEDLSIVFNGEIYNYKEIKSELEALSHKFVSNSDTEVILHAFKEWGVKTVHKFIGMFAFVILNKKENKITIFRDRAGVKPLYYYKKDNLFLFASELKSFHKHPGFEKSIDLSSLRLFFDYGYVPAPYSIFKNCFKLEPGHYLELDLNTFRIDIKEYWNVEEYYQLPKIDLSYKEAKENVHSLFKSAFNYRMVADVPVGVFLSGGYDSTVVTAILQNEQQERLKTYTIGFEKKNDEAPFAKETAKYLGTDHTEYYITTKEAQEIIPTLPFFYDEPFFDSSAIPTMLVSSLAKKDVTVALSADGGDEIFAGYKSYPSLLNRLNTINKIPDSLKAISSNILSIGASLLPESKIDIVHRLQGLSEALDRNKLRQAKSLFHQIHTFPKKYGTSLFLNTNEKYTSGFESISLNCQDEIELVMAVDYKMYLPNDILTKVDRATMSVSLEGREPLLDHRIIEFAAQLPREFKFDGIATKKILKDIVHDYIPKEMMDRPKTGFSIPIYSWLRNDLSYLLDEYLNKEALIESNVFNVEFVLEKVALFKKNKLHYVTMIWKILMFQMWYKKWCA